jgi:hypothetical protein
MVEGLADVTIGLQLFVDVTIGLLLIVCDPSDVTTGSNDASFTCCLRLLFDNVDDVFNLYDSRNTLTL